MFEMSAGRMFETTVLKGAVNLKRLKNTVLEIAFVPTKVRTMIKKWIDENACVNWMWQLTTLLYLSMSSCAISSIMPR